VVPRPGIFHSELPCHAQILSASHKYVNIKN
jgi:hypothetical protein